MQPCDGAATPPSREDIMTSCGRQKTRALWAILSVVLAGGGCADKSSASASTKASESATSSGTTPAPVLRIGVLTDMSGPYADPTGKGSVEAARMAVEDFGGKVNDTRSEKRRVGEREKPGGSV